MNEREPDPESVARATGVPPGVIAALRQARPALRWVAVLAVCFGALLLAFAATVALAAWTASPLDASETSGQYLLAALFVLAAGPAFYFAVRAWMAANSIRTAEVRGLPDQLRWALSEQAGAWRALAVAVAAALAFPILLFCVAIWSLAQGMN
jgi:hypothetical protein